ncbi:MAG: PD-(D/E)XK nuclease family protein [Candidatus Staskawiczbacteria bacterium]|nr:PD-(D/E)XK nuclease family protein [Candidatus Staskawiczbacteria bacterium]
MLKELIDQFYIDNQKNRDQTKFYITDAGKCPRAVFFKFKNAPKEPMDARILRIFEHGENIHRNIYNILYRLRMGVVTEVSIPSQEIISGRADAILCVGNENYVLDIKSINSMIFRKMQGPKEENILQIQLYLHFFNIKKGILLYIDKDQQEMKEFFVDYDEKQEMKEFFVDYDETLCKSLLDKFYVLKDQVEKNIVPARLADYPKNWQCNYCQFKDVCKLANGETINWEDFKKKIEAQSQTA